MHIRKQRLLTPGPTPLYPPALHAMMASDMHHRTEDFRKTYKSALAGLKQACGTANDVLCFTASGTGAMDAAVSNLFSRGDSVVVCSAGKFGERWIDIAKAYGLNATVIQMPYGEVVTSGQVKAAMTPETKGVFVQASESSTGAEHDVKGMAEVVRNTDALLVVDAITGLGTMPLDIDAWGLDVVIGGSQKAFMIPPGLAFMTVSAKAWKAAETANLPHYYFDLKQEKKMGDIGESSWTPATSLILALDEALRYINGIGMAQVIANAQLLAKATRDAAKALGLEVYAKRPGSAVTGIKAPAGLDAGVIVKAFRDRFGAIMVNGQGSMKGKMFRVAHLGYFDALDTVAVIASLELILRANGHPVELGSGVAAVQRVIEASEAPKLSSSAPAR